MNPGNEGVFPGFVYSVVFLGGIPYFSCISNDLRNLATFGAITTRQ